MAIILHDSIRHDNNADLDSRQQPWRDVIAWSLFVEEKEGKESGGELVVPKPRAAGAGVGREEQLRDASHSTVGTQASFNSSRSSSESSE